MTEVPIKIRFSKSLNNLLPSRLIVVKPDNASDFELYVTDKSGNPFPLKDEGGIINSIINSDGNLVITGTEDKIINISPALLSVINSALQSGDNISELVNDVGYITIADLPTPTPFADQTEVNNGLVTDKVIAPNTLAGWWTYVKGLAQTFAQKITFSSGALFSPQVAPTYERGRIYFDNANDCISFMDSISGTSVQVGYEVLMRARNNTGATILNGSVVYISGAIGQNSTVALAQSNTLPTSEIIGIATHNIANNTVGKICVFGLINDVDTSIFTDGQMLYLSATVAGGLTSSIPASPNFVVALGVVEHAHPTQGKILVRPQRALANNNALGTAQNVPPTQNAVKTALDSKVDKVTTAGVERVWAYGTDGIGFEKPISDFTIQPYFTFSTNTTLNNSHHNAVIWVTDTCNITIPSGLRSDFNCTVRTFTGAIATYLTSGTVINTESDGSIQSAKTMSYIAQYSTNNYIISGGGLS